MPIFCYLAGRRLVSQRLVLFLGFGNPLLLMTRVAYGSNRTLVHIGSENAAVRLEFLRPDDLLDRVRSNLFNSSIGSGRQCRDFDRGRMGPKETKQL